MCENFAPLVTWSITMLFYGTRDKQLLLRSSKWTDLCVGFQVRRRPNINFITNDNQLTLFFALQLCVSFLYSDKRRSMFLLFVEAPGNRSIYRLLDVPLIVFLLRENYRGGGQVSIIIPSICPGWQYNNYRNYDYIAVNTSLWRKSNQIKLFFYSQFIILYNIFIRGSFIRV